MNARIGAAIVAFSVVTFAGCSGGTQSNPTPVNASPAPSLRSETAFGSSTSPLVRRATVSQNVLYTFHNFPDGRSPFAGLIDVKGKLYGTTYYGGLGCVSNSGCGTVFRVTTSGRETVLYRFAADPDGNHPSAGLINVNGSLYGTTQFGGLYGSGTVFAVTMSGGESVLHSFGNGADGSSPVASLINVRGTLYGTTYTGGAGSCSGIGNPGCGTIFQITPSGGENVLYTFAGGTDGAYPIADLIDVNGTLYGTTFYGGANAGSPSCHNGSRIIGCGTVFEITPSGGESVIYRFAGGTDGANPRASLTDVNGTLYGTTVYGGAHGFGTVFKIAPSGGYSQLYSFAGGTDGSLPYVALTDVSGTLYGTTLMGGGYGCDSQLGCGTAFQITPAGAESVIYRFVNRKRGWFPNASLIDVNGTLYSTASAGGRGQRGLVFSLSLTEPGLAR